MFNSDYGLGMMGGGWGWGNFWPTLSILVMWSIFWKGLALWHSGRKGEHLWFIALLIINTAGLLEIFYLFAILKLKFDHLFKK
ncbi:MAG: DUF5652 family protein [Patescibacteria group bacterium]